MQPMGGTTDIVVRTSYIVLINVLQYIIGEPLPLRLVAQKRFPAIGRKLNSRV